MQLEERTASPVHIPSHWASDIQVECDADCQDCPELNTFLSDPQARVHRQIASHHCDLDTATERTGSTHTLACTKNRASYQRRQDRYETDLACLAELRTLNRESPSSPVES